MRYEIKGTPFPYVELTLNQGEAVKCEAGSMSWMTPNMSMQTSGGGIGKMFSRGFSGERMFQNIYSCQSGVGTIAMSSSFPGQIVAVEVHPGQEFVAQKSAFLASTMGVEMSIFFQKRLGAGFFGGEGFIMQKFSGEGLVFLEFDGSVEAKTLGMGEQLIIDTGYLAMCDATCSVDVKSVGGFKNTLFGGEGFFNTVVTGPGKVTLQSMPISSFASIVGAYVPSSN